jgi:hypothetical protein
VVGIYPETKHPTCECVCNMACPASVNGVLYVSDQPAAQDLYSIGHTWHDSPQLPSHTPDSNLLLMTHQGMTHWWLSAGNTP